MKANGTSSISVTCPSWKEDLAVRPHWSHIDASLSYSNNKPYLWVYANQTMAVCAKDMSVMLNLNLEKINLQC